MAWQGRVIDRAISKALTIFGAVILEGPRCWNSRTKCSPACLRTTLNSPRSGKVEIGRRIAEDESGAVVCEDWDVVEKRLLAKYPKA